MADENELDGVIDLANQAHGSVSQNIGKLQQLIKPIDEFKKVAKFIDTVPEWSTEEGRRFFELMAQIKNACNSYGEVLGGTRRYVICAQAFAKDTVNFVTGVQREDLEPDDIEDIFGDFTDSIEKMKESNEQVTILRDEFKSVLVRLRDAQLDAAAGQLRGKENTVTNTACAGLAAGGSLLATSFGPFLVLGCLALTFVKDVVTSKEWEVTFDFVLCRLDEVYSILDAITNDCTMTLDQLSHSSKEIMDKSKRMTERKKPAISGYFKQKCIQLAEESETLEKTCIKFIRQDDEIRGIAGAMNRLSMI